MASSTRPRSTTLDLANFALLHLHAGRFQSQVLLTPASVALMHTPQVSLYTVHDEGYGLTFRTERYKGIRLLRHHGLFMCYSSIFYLAPDHGMGVSILFNSIAAPVGADALAKSIFDELLALPAEQALPPDSSSGPLVRLSVAVNPSEWPHVTGEYLGLNAGLATIAVVEDHLTLDLNGTVVPLQMHAPHVYFGHSPMSGTLVSVGFVPPSGYAPNSVPGATRHLLVNGSLFERFARNPDYRPDLARLATYVGVYVGETGTLVARSEQGALVVHSPEDDLEARCVALGPTSFVGSLGLMEFTADEMGRVTGVTRGRFYPFQRVAE